MKVNSTTILTAAAVSTLTAFTLAFADQVGFTTSGVGGRPVTAPQPIDAPCGDIVLNQSADPKTLGTGTVQCAVQGAHTTANGLARSFPVDDALSVCAVQFGIQTNIGGDWPLTVNLYAGDINGPFGALELRGISEISIPAGAGPEFFVAMFELPVQFLPGENMIVELYHPTRNPDAGGDGGALWPGSNGSGQTAPSYIRAPECGIENFVDYAEIGFAAVHLTIKVFAQHDDDGGSPCPGDLNGDGVVDVSDLLTLLASWGPCPGCPADINGDGVVDVSDLLHLLSDWGDCPGPPGDSCVGNCGGVAPDGCYCDELCCEYQDCCDDKHEACGGCEPPPPGPRLNAVWGEGFTDEDHRDLATAALAWWDARIDQGKLQKIAIEFQFVDLSLLGVLDDGTNWIPLHPENASLNSGPLATAAITEVSASGKPTKGTVRFNSKFSWYVGEAWPPPPGECPPDRHDMWTVLKHEIAHVLGFNEFLAKYSDNVSQNAEGEWWYNENGDPKARLAGGHVGGKSHTHPDAHPDDLMNETLAACHRRDDKDLTASILNHGIWDPNKE